MGIWYKSWGLEVIQQMASGNMLEHLGIQFTGIGDDWLEASMPVDHRTRQPYGILHGGASVVLAETLGSIAANLVVDPERQSCVGLEVNANHLRPVPGGLVYGVARPVHLGGRTQVWDIRIRDERDRPICISRLTVAVLPKPGPKPCPAASG